MAGGPGSGDSTKNTRMILEDFKGLKISSKISIGKRTDFMTKNEPTEKNKKISVDKIKYVGQEKYVPKKLEKFIEDPSLLEKPIDVLKDSKGEYHVMDGHHRFLAAKRTDKETLQANVYRGE